MRFLAIIQRNENDFSPQQFEPLLEPEAEYVRKLYTEGIFRSVASRGDVKGAVVELECKSKEEAQKVLEELPLAAAGMLDVRIIPLLPYRGFAPRNP